MTIHDLVSAMCNGRAREQGILTLGELRAALKMAPADALVTINGESPAKLSSYRGYYERLAIGSTRHRDDYKTELHDGGPGFDSAHFGHYQPGASSVSIAEPVTVAELVKALDLADGATFEGYKGGQFDMHAGTFIHFAEYGDCGDAVVGVRLDGERVVIDTAEEEW